MKKRIFYLIGFIFFIIGIYLTTKIVSDIIEEKKRKEKVMNMEHTASQNVRILIDTIEVEYLNEKRTLGIYLPENYEDDTASYSVLYFLDGQSLFDQKIQEGNEWQLDEVLDSLGRISQEQSIIVGLYNSEDRVKEYSPLPSTQWFSGKDYSGDKHAEWIVSSVKPWIDARYRTKKEAKYTVIGGASLGGLMSFYMLMKYPTVFGGAIVFSPSFWINKEVFKLHENNKNIFNQRIYFNAGDLEPSTVQNVKRMYEILLKYGVPKKNLMVDTEKDLGHSHMTWRNGFRKAYPWIIRDK
ncbi:alpha/beta hydrolase-fold protein [Algoriphagus sp.]|uniref:alpha/beta hydrolase n=1 Tax=Algoriphagus sp. TaxID=1872435 RepID=UPI0025CEBF13|nr:alpha/beta hydrolase-fold protein [Algoriphagus sp.]